MYLNSEFRILLIAASFPEVNIERRKSKKQISTTITDKSVIHISESPVLLKISLQSKKNSRVAQASLMKSIFSCYSFTSKRNLKNDNRLFSFLFFFSDFAGV